MIQRIPIDGGFTCPNRDGAKASGGCTFCLPAAFAPAYCRQAGSITQQLLAGQRFFARRRRRVGEERYLAYFQSYSATYAPLAVLRQRYLEALSVPGVCGLVIATRPDCITPAVLDLLAELRQLPVAASTVCPAVPPATCSVMVEYGIESCYDRTLLRVNRGHDFACTQRAIRLTAERGIAVGGHLILGLPGESRADILREADILSLLPITSLKLHQLQIFRGTPMADEWQLHPSHFIAWTPQSYARFVAAFIRRLRPDIHIERYAASAPSSLLISPRWGLHPHQVQAMVRQLLDSSESPSDLSEEE